MRLSAQIALRLGAPLLAALGAWAVARDFIAPGVDLDAMARGVAGPGTWPKTMLYCAAATALAIFVRAVLVLRRPGERAAPAAEAGYDDAKLIGGIALLALYGFGITQIGMAWATLVFIAGWLVLSGLRRPLAVLLVSTLGTAAIVYMFVKVSLMPLDRGHGIFEQATILLYRLLGIY